jgi:hypothetical protein
MGGRLVNLLDQGCHGDCCVNGLGHCARVFQTLRALLVHLWIPPLRSTLEILWEAA